MGLHKVSPLKNLSNTFPVDVVVKNDIYHISYPVDYTNLELKELLNYCNDNKLKFNIKPKSGNLVGRPKGE
jgi:hypothetical protein